MNTKKFLFIVLTVLFSTLGFAGNSKIQEVTKDTIRLFPVNEQTTLEIHNRYGKIDIKNWEKNEVRIHVTIKVSGDKVEDAQSYFDRTHIIFRDSVNLVRVQTIIDKEKSFFHFFEQMEKGSFEVNYEIYAPVYMKLNLHNKYGDIFLNEVHGYTQIFLKYGNLSAKNLFFPAGKPLSIINIKYGNAEIANGKKLVLNTKYSNVKIEHATALIAISKYSGYKIQSVLAAVCNSKYDTYKIGNIKSLKFSGKYETIKIDTLSRNLKLDLEYGSISIAYLLPTTKEVTIQASYTDIKLKVARKMDFTLDGDFNYTGFSPPYDFSIFSSKVDNQHSIIKGFCGNRNSSQHFSFICQYGDIKIKNFD